MLFRSPVNSFGDELERAIGRVNVVGVSTDNRPPMMVYDPSHPDANAQGYVAYPDINIMQEMVDMMSANRTYEANASVVDSTTSMAQRALEIGR